MNKQMVEKIAMLARIRLSEEDIPYYQASLNKLLALEEKMLNIDTTNVEPMFHSLDAIQVMREDKVTESNQRERLQSLAPKTVAGLYLVPKVIE